MEQQASENSPAPALDRGLQIIELLGQCPEASLETLANLSQCPKSSLKRILDTLEQWHVVERLSSKNYVLRKCLVPRQSLAIDLQQVVLTQLQQVSDELGLTTEWYQLDERSAVLSQRCEPEMASVRVVATVGYQRFFDGELDAVNLALLHSGATQLRSDANYWTYSCELTNRLTQSQQTSTEPNESDKYSLNLQQAKQFVKACAETFHNSQAPDCCCDPTYNTNGIRRIAQAVVNPAGNIIGVFAIAEHFQPGADRLRPQRAAALARAVRYISEHC